MASVGTVWANLNLNIQSFARSITQAGAMLGRFASNTASVAAGTSTVFGGYGREISNANKALAIHNTGLKDVKRIVAGIVISQTFYGISNAIQDATNKLWDFNEALDYAKVTYSALFGSAELGTDFLAVLQDYAEKTIFSFEDLADMSKKLLAYGIPYKNLMYITEGLTSLGAMSGDAASLDRIALALGQIYTKGKLSAEEMRQLANAYVPIYNIVKEQFGLTGDQMKRVGDLNLPAADVINAVVDYANDKFGEVADAAMFTITGLKQKIVDSLKNMGVEILAPISTFYKSLLVFISRQLQNIREAFDAGGIGGIFEYFVPDPDQQQRIRLFLANLYNLFMAISRAVSVAWKATTTLFNSFIDTFNTLAPVITGATNILSAFGAAVLNNTVAVKVLSGALVAGVVLWMLYKAQALAAAVIVGLTRILYSVATALLFVSRAIATNPLVAFMLAIGAALAIAAVSATNADNAITRLFNKLSNYGGNKSADDVLQLDDALKETDADASQFGERLNDITDSIEDSGKAAEAAAKKAGLLSFDEVFKLNDTGTDTSALGGIGDIIKYVGRLGAILGDLLEVPDLSSYTDKFVDELLGSLWKSLKSIASGGLSGALVGGLVGFTIGGLVTRTLAGALAGAKLGATIGTVAGAGFAGFWTDTYNELESSLQAVAIGSGVGAAVGGLVGLVVGAFATKSLKGAIAIAGWGAGIGALLGSGIGGFWAIATEEMGSSIEKLMAGGAAGTFIGGLAGLVIGAFVGKSLSTALYGALLGSSIGSLVGVGLGAFWSIATEEMNKAIEGAVLGGAAGSLVGGLTGFIIGAFVSPTGERLKGAITGAKWGSAIGTLIGGGLGTFWATASDELKAKIESVFVSASEGALAGGIAGMVIGAFITRTLAGAAAGAKWGASLGSLIGVGLEPIFKDGEESLTAGIEGMFSTVEATGYGALIGGLAGLILGAVIGAFAGGIGALPGAKAGASLGAAIGSLGVMLYQWLAESGIAEKIGAWFSDMWASISGWFIQVDKDLGEWSDQLDKDIAAWFEQAWADVSGWFKQAWADIWAWNAQAKKDIDEWFAQLWSNISGWYVQADKDLDEWFAQLWTDVSAWFVQADKDTGEWLSQLWTDIWAWNAQADKDIDDWFEQAWADVSGWFKQAWADVNQWLADLWSDIDEWFDGLWADVEEWWADLWDPTSWDSAWDSLGDWFNQLFVDIGSWFNGIGKTVRSWWADLWNLDKPEPELPDSVQTYVSSGATTRVSGGSSNFSGSVRLGHAAGGIFSREHIARFAENNKAEAVIPLENASAMQPFVNAISTGIVETLAPAMASGAGSNALPPMYVGTLIADERGLKELYKKFELYEVKEMARKGLA